MAVMAVCSDADDGILIAIAPFIFITVSWNIKEENTNDDECQQFFKIGEPTRVYPKLSGLDAWSENFKWYSSLPLGAVVSLFCELV
jgi:hypothetical protein